VPPPIGTAVPKASATSFFPERPLSPSGPPTSKEPAPIEPVDLVAGGMEFEGGDVLGRDGEAGLLREGAEGESVGGGDVVEGEGDGDEAPAAETLHLVAIPGMADSIRKGMKTPAGRRSRDPGW